MGMELSSLLRHHLYPPATFLHFALLPGAPRRERHAAAGSRAVRSTGQIEALDHPTRDSTVGCTRHAW